MEPSDLETVQGGFLLPDGRVFGLDHYYVLVHGDVAYQLYLDNVTNLSLGEIYKNGWIEVRNDSIQFPRDLETVTDEQLIILIEYVEKFNRPVKVAYYDAGRTGNMTKEILLDVLSGEVSRKSLGLMDQYLMEKNK